MRCPKPNVYKCVIEGVGVILFIPTTTSTTTTISPCQMVDCEGNFLVDCECNYISCVDCAALCIIADCENDILIDCLGDIIECKECGETTSTTTTGIPEEGGDFVASDFSSMDFYTGGLLNPPL